MSEWEGQPVMRPETFPVGRLPKGKEGKRDTAVPDTSHSHPLTLPQPFLELASCILSCAQNVT